MNQAFERCSCGAMTYYKCREIAVRHCFTTKFGGVSTGDCAGLNFRRDHGDSDENVLRNYRIMADAISVPFERLTLTHQVHRCDVTTVTEENCGTGIVSPLYWETDALITALPNTPLIGFYADCVVTLLYDPTTHTCGVAHAGWRGTAQQILRKTADAMAEQFGAVRETMRAAIGPSIRVCCFETDADVPEAMVREMGLMAEPFIHARGAKYDVDLQGMNRSILLSAGLKPEHIFDSEICTKCQHDEFWSHRATNGKRGVQAGLICL